MANRLAPLGYSFQLAKTATLYSITDYCIATALSWQRNEKFGLYQNVSVECLKNVYLHKKKCLKL